MISEVLHIQNQIVCCIETFHNHLYMSKGSKSYCNRYIQYIEGLIMHYAVFLFPQGHRPLSDFFNCF